MKYLLFRITVESALLVLKRPVIQTSSLQKLVFRSVTRCWKFYVTVCMNAFNFETCRFVTVLPVKTFPLDAKCSIIYCLD